VPEAAEQGEVLPNIKHLVVLMLENRSFDHMFGFADPDNDEIDDLSGAEFCPGPDGKPVLVTDDARPAGVVDPGHKLFDVNEQLFGNPDPPAEEPKMKGFVRNYAKQPGVTPARAGDVMRCFAPENIPVLTTLAREFALCDGYFSSVPGPTLPNRAFAHCASSNGSVDNNPLAFARLTTVYERLAENGVDSKVFAFDGNSLATSLPVLLKAGKKHLGSYDEFLTAVKKGKLPAYSFVEPRYNNYFDQSRQKAYFASNQHPPNDVGRGEELIADVYEAIRRSAAWEETLFVITYDEHGGFYDHVPPPASVPPNKPNGTAKPDALTGFDFTRLGVRVPTLFISPFIERGTIVKRTAGKEFDHSSLGATARALFAPAAGPLNDRDAVARTFADVFNRESARADNDTPVKLDRRKLKVPARPANIGKGPLSDHQSAQVQAAARLDELLPAEKRVLGSAPEFKTLQDIRTEQRAQDYIKAVTTRARKYWAD
jgi:phospholipase C